MTFLAKHPEVPFYSGLNEAVLKQWREEDQSLQQKVDGIVAHIESEQAAFEDVDEVVARANRLLPLVRALMFFYSRRGILENPAVHDVIAGRRAGGFPWFPALRGAPKNTGPEVQNRGLMASDARVTF